MNKLLSSCLLALWLGCAPGAESAKGNSPASTARGPERQHATEIETPAVLRGLPLVRDDAGAVIATAPCSTCHGTRELRPLPESAEQVGGPHAGLTVRHGSLRCAACHDATQRDRLHLADGRSIPLLEAMELCAQCHGPQKRDYDHGAHGGIRGHWDLRSGPRTRNHCVSCHDPHGPRFGKFLPVAPPRDRFSPQNAEEVSSHD